MNKVFVRVSFHDTDGPPYNGAVAEVFVDHSDSYAQIRKAAVAAAREFFQKALAAPAGESAPGSVA